MRLTTPPVALPPYSSAAGPRSTSMRSATSGSSATAWSKLRLDASTEAPLLSSKRTRSPSRPRITGRLALGPKPLAATPGRPSSVSPSVAPRRSIRPLPDRLVTACAPGSRPSGLPVMTTVSCAAALAQHRAAAQAQARGHAGARLMVEEDMFSSQEGADGPGGANRDTDGQPTARRPAARGAVKPGWGWRAAANGCNPAQHGLRQKGRSALRRGRARLVASSRCCSARRCSTCLWCRASVLKLPGGHLRRPQQVGVAQLVDQTALGATGLVPVGQTQTGRMVVFMVVVGDMERRGELLRRRGAVGLRVRRRGGRCTRARAVGHRVRVAQPLRSQQGRAQPQRTRQCQRRLWAAGHGGRHGASLTRLSMP